MQADRRLGQMAMQRAAAHHHTFNRLQHHIMTTLLSSAYFPVIWLLASVLALYGETHEILTSPLLSHRHSLSLARLLVLLTTNRFHILLTANIWYSMIYAIGRIVQYFTFGKVSRNEMRKLKEDALQFTLFRLVVIGALVENESREILVWCQYFAVIGLMRALLTLALERFNTLNASAVVRRQSLLHILYLAAGIITCNIMLAALTYYTLYAQASMSLLLILSYEYTTVGIIAIKVLGKYMLQLPNAVDTAHDAGDFHHTTHPEIINIDEHESGSGMEERSPQQFALDTICDSVMHILTLSHLLHTWVLYTFQFTLVDLYMFFAFRTVLVQLYTKLYAWYTYRRSLRSISEQYADCTREELAEAAAQGEKCTICHEYMSTAKRLECGHRYHQSCLREMLLHRNTCAVCRRPLSNAAQPQPQQANSPSNTGIEPELLRALQHMDLGAGSVSPFLSVQQQQQIALDAFQRRHRRQQNNASARANNNAASSNTSTQHAAAPPPAFARFIAGRSIFSLDTRRLGRLASWLPGISLEVVRADITSNAILHPRGSAQSSRHTAHSRPQGSPDSLTEVDWNIFTSTAVPSATSPAPTDVVDSSTDSDAGSNNESTSSTAQHVSPSESQFATASIDSND